MMDQVNFLPWRPLKTSRQRHHWYCRCLGTLIATGLLFITLFIRLDMLHEQQKKIYNKVQQHCRQQSAFQHPFAQNSTLQQALNQQRRQMAQQLLQIAHLIPKGVYLQQLHWQQQKLILTGSALSYPLLITLMDNLECHKKQSMLQLEPAVTDKNQIAPVQFSLQLSWPISTV